MSVREAPREQKSKRPRIKRTPKPRAAKAAPRIIPKRWKIHPDYTNPLLCPDGWYPQASTMLMLGKKIQSGCARALIDFVNARMNDHNRAGHKYWHLPADKWTDTQQHDMATAPMSMQEIAEGVGFSLRAVEYNMADMLKRKGLARLASEDRQDRLFQYTVPFLHFDKVIEPEPGSDSESEANPSASPKSEQEPPGSDPHAEPTPGGAPDENDGETADGKPRARKFKARGSKRIETPAISSLILSEAVAKQVAFDFEVVAGEMRINGFELIPAGPTATNHEGESEANSSAYSEGEPKANTQGETKAKGELIPKDLRENSPQSFAGSTSLPFLPSEEPETSVIIEAVESLRARTGRPLKYNVRVSGDYIEVEISPREVSPEEPASPPRRPADPSPSDAPDSIAPILEAFKPVGGITYTKALHLLKDGGDLTGEEIGTKASEIIPGVVVQRKVDNKVGLVIHKLQEFFKSPEDVKQWRREREEIEVKESEATQRKAEREREKQELFEQFLKEEMEKAGGGS